MKRIVITLIFVLFLSTPAHAEWFSWDKGNTELHAPLTVLLITDMGQTLWAQEHRWSKGISHESNKILGKHPNRGEIASYFVASYALTTALVYALPEKWSHALQWSVITLEVHVVNHNHSLGIGVKF